MLNPITYATVCSGIDAPAVAWNPLGWKQVFSAEIEKFPSAVLAHHYPEVPNLGNMTKIDGAAYRGKVDVLIGGTPCQAFSVAGSRKSLSDDRGNLTLKYVELCNAINPNVVVWENVPGVLSTADNAFGCFLGALSGHGSEVEPGPRPPVGKDSKLWKWNRKVRRHIPSWANAGWVAGPRRTIAWRSFDAQYFSLAQRRIRILLAACPTGGTDPRKILFEQEGVRRDTPPRRKKGNDITPPLTSRPYGDNSSREGKLIYAEPVAKTLKGRPCSSHREDSNSYVAQLPVPDVSPTLNSRDYKGLSCGRDGMTGAAVVHILPFDTTQVTSRSNHANPKFGNPCHSLAAGAHAPAIFCECQTDKYVRRLIPIECERLQGFPDNYTQIPWNKKSLEDCPDGHRYKALGNSMPVTVIRWIGERIVRELRDMVRVAEVVNA